MYRAAVEPSQPAPSCKLLKRFKSALLRRHETAHRAHNSTASPTYCHGLCVVWCPPSCGYCRWRAAGLRPQTGYGAAILVLARSPRCCPFTCVPAFSRSGGHRWAPRCIAFAYHPCARQQCHSNCSQPSPAAHDTFTWRRCAMPDGCAQSTEQFIKLHPELRHGLVRAQRPS